ncbi:alpha-ketoacid dehydrogenase subunit beta [Mycobacterium sp. CVI_P3]|uniref:Alpha-ketoacid dehydrogenase subunit beta n=1 Tax=Mycobacterium pinniadriaticum TaxID=2994102 RepID=A0ABT3SD38_9MYCO|nr:alpha-ketoacid dehydrogenase subunit beta [Mycobacterium pinniadriaticum]MCX2930863.1 alpha-ketoacid dehydrogenase subunit beta [Mycobacterium pinniadriaticum]MCX2937287.1 alpha-ketoacid dehydrogenase subunit beta [Mycobacterium pinniadriaticum]
MTSTAPARSTRKLTAAKAIVEAISTEMASDESVFVMGEDVGKYGGVFGETTGLLDRFGPERVIDTPISETAFIGAAVGAAVEGMRPIVELMFVDFFGVCMDQIYNHMAKIHLLSGGHISVPLVLMTAVGGGYSDAAQHSQCLWGTFAHLPGMKVVVPSSPEDAKGMMTAAIRDDNPVVFMYHKGIMGLSWMSKSSRSLGPVPREAYEVELGKAKVVRAGNDISIVTLSLSVHHALDIADELAHEGIDCEVVDLRSLVPLDTETVLESVGKTGRLLVIDEDYESFGLSGEIIARVSERDPGLFKTAPARVCVPDVSLPYARPLEMAVLPTPERIRAAVVEMMRK